MGFALRALQTLARAAPARLAAGAAAASIGCGYLSYGTACEPALCTPAESKSLVGKVALVTGGTGSIGRCVAQSLAIQGCRVVVVDLDEQKCQEFAASLPTPSLGISIDVSSEDAVTQGYERIARELGPVDILVNVAGARRPHPDLLTPAARVCCCRHPVEQ